ncbi:MAG: pyruvate, phosphate dikinase [Dehalococcoidia bacterium]|nr:MAG: pyruvate, phosphate dikinase [Dehalococcoidia bacterium]
MRIEAKKWVYFFSEGNAGMTDLLGGKGAHLAEMANVGFPVPPGFVISTEACNEYYAAGEEFPPALWDQVLEALRRMEKETGKRFGDPRNPLLVSARSGGKVSMPGMMETVLNLGLNEEPVRGLGDVTGTERFAYDPYRRFIGMFGRTVLGIDSSHFEAVLEQFKLKAGARLDADLGSEDLKAIVSESKRLVKAETGKEFPDDPLEQLRLSIEAVFESWNGRRAINYRNFHKIPHDLGTAVSIMAMVFGNMGDDSGAGVAFTRDPATGDKTLYGEYLANAQGEDVVAGIRTPQKVELLQLEMPEVYQELVDISDRLETHYRDVQDIEFTVERGKLYILQTRTAKRTAKAAVKAAVDMVKEGLITKEEALKRIEPGELLYSLFPRFDEGAKEEARSQGDLLARGLNASPGAATGKAVFDADRAEQLGSRGESIILVRPETSAEDVHGMLVAAGILTARGGVTSHAAVVARGLGKPCVAGCEELRIDLERRYLTAGGRVIEENEEISIDGSTGEVFAGRIPTIVPKLSEESDLIALLGWADEVRRLGVWANADYPSDAARALEFGAEGIGLCRTEHMFFEEERLPIVQKMILSAAEATALQNELIRLQEEKDRRGKLEERLAEVQRRYDTSAAAADYRSALAELMRFQREDFKGIFRVMAGKPVVIRLVDPPLHEFLPSYERVLVETTEFRIRGNDPVKLAESENLLRAIESMRETNPMLGLRGCRLGLMFGDIYEMQVRAILTAACGLAKEGIDVRPKIMIPLVGHPNEMRVLREKVEKVAREVEAEMGTMVDYKIGVMIELPRAALTADEIAHYAEFFSFGTNDLTQTTFGFSRDDAEGKFLLQYVERGILPENPFQVLDRDGVGRLIKVAVELGRKTRPDIELGICGEHGGDPSSIHFCHQVGLDYVSCSPFRVPIARLAAAQAALSAGEG